MYSDAVTTSVAQVIGRNAYDLRRGAGIKLEDFAREARLCGLPWSSGRVGDFESGRVTATLPTIYTVALVLTRLTAKPVTLADLFAGSGDVQINDAVTVPAAALADAMAGKPVTGSPVAAEQPTEKTSPWKRLPLRLRREVNVFDWLEVKGNLRDTDKRLCRELDIDYDLGAAFMTKLWGQTYIARRDELAGPRANAQRRGQISRQLKTDLEKVIGNGHH
jgi:transcriptional regulator with XRE-family HTH domain